MRQHSLTSPAYLHVYMCVFCVCAWVYVCVCVCVCMHACVCKDTCINLHLHHVHMSKTKSDPRTLNHHTRYSSYWNNNIYRIYNSHLDSSASKMTSICGSASLGWSFTLGWGDVKAELSGDSAHGSISRSLSSPFNKQSGSFSIDCENEQTEKQSVKILFITYQAKQERNEHNIVSLPKTIWLNL